MSNVTIIIRTDYAYLKHLPVSMGQVLKDSLRYLSDGATDYNPAYASGRWDGFVSLYNPFQCSFPTGLTLRVRQILEKHGHEVTIDASELPPFVCTERVYTPVHQLREYQERAVSAALSHRRGVLSIPTGGGKTEVAQEVLSRSAAARVLFLVPTTHLLNQTYRRFQSAFPSTAIYRWGDGHRPPKAMDENFICVATAQSACRNLKHPAITTATMVWVDESHHQAAATFKKVTAAAYQSRYFLGLSATPYRSGGDDMELEAWLGPLIFDIDYETLIAEGYLVPPKFIKVFTLQEGLAKCEGYRTIIFSETKQELEAIRDELDALAIPIVTGDDATPVREEWLRKLASNEIRAIAATPLFDEGVDVPAVDCTFFYNTCGTRTKAVQRIGRAMRPSPGKDHCLVVDMVDKQYRNRLLAYLAEPAFASRLKG